MGFAAAVSGDAPPGTVLAVSVSAFVDNSVSAVAGMEVLAPIGTVDPSAAVDSVCDLLSLLLLLLLLLLEVVVFIGGCCDCSVDSVFGRSWKSVSNGVASRGALGGWLQLRAASIALALTATLTGVILSFQVCVVLPLVVLLVLLLLLLLVTMVISGRTDVHVQLQSSHATITSHSFCTVPYPSDHSVNKQTPQRTIYSSTPRFRTS
jgi:hypothetical protein